MNRTPAPHARPPRRALRSLRFVRSLRRPRLLPGLFAVMLVGALALAASPGGAHASAALAPQAYTDQLMVLLNQERRGAGLPELAEAAPAARVASTRVLDMAANNYFAHASPSGVTWVELLRAEGMPFGWGGENLAWCDFPPHEVVAVMHRMLMASQGHRENILRPQFRQVGIAVAVNERGSYYAAFIFTD